MIGKLRGVTLVLPPPFTGEGRGGGRSDFMRLPLSPSLSLPRERERGRLRRGWR